MGFFLVIVAALLIIVAWVVVAHRRERQRVAVAKPQAEARGFAFDATPQSPPALGFSLFQVGSRRQMSYRTWREGSPDSIFQYRFTVGTGKNQQTHRRSCALLAVPFVAPHLTLGPEGFWSGVGRAVGLRDLEVGASEFDQRFRVRCDDERFAADLLSDEVVGWLMSPAGGAGAIKLELGGHWLLCLREHVDYPELFALLEWGEQLRSRLPAALSERYPPR